jgi:hypothetical protein
MQSEFGMKIEEERKRIRREIKHFLDLEEIPYEENENEIRIKGNIIFAELEPYPSIKVRVGTHKYLTIEERTDRFIFYYFNGFSEICHNEKEILKSNIPFTKPLIIYLDGKLVFLF